VVPGPTIRVPAGSDRKIRVDLENAFIRPDERLISGQEGFEPSTATTSTSPTCTSTAATCSPSTPRWTGPACEGEGCGRNPADGDSLANDYYGDNVLIEVPYISRAKYRWDIDEDHLAPRGHQLVPPPHPRQRRASSWLNGAAGAIIIEGDARRPAPVAARPKSG
jgi:hypothetical protein